MINKIGIMIASMCVLLAITACSSSSAARDPYNDADSQRERSGGAQDEMRRDTSKY